MELQFFLDALTVRIMNTLQKKNYEIKQNLLIIGILFQKQTKTKNIYANKKKYFSFDFFFIFLHLCFAELFHFC